MAAFSQPADGKGFFGSLFDFSFRHFVTLKFIKVIYAILFTLIVLATLIFMISAINSGGPGIIIGIIVAPAAGLLYLIFLRISLEVIAVLFRIGENTSTLVAGGWRPPSGPEEAPLPPPVPPSGLMPTPPATARQDPSATGPQRAAPKKAAPAKKAAPRKRAVPRSPER